MRLSRAEYERMIAEDSAWLSKQPLTLESIHIQMILDRAVDYEYGVKDAWPRLTLEELEQIRLEMLTWLKDGRNEKADLSRAIECLGHVLASHRNHIPKR